eukprot:6186166-Pleurochrysis_carterae.AAC.1
MEPRLVNYAPDNLETKNGAMVGDAACSHRAFYSVLHARQHRRSFSKKRQSSEDCNHLVDASCLPVPRAVRANLAPPRRQSVPCPDPNTPVVPTPRTRCYPSAQQTVAVPTLLDSVTRRIAHDAIRSLNKALRK